MIAQSIDTVRSLMSFSDRGGVLPPCTSEKHGGLLSDPELSHSELLDTLRPVVSPKSRVYLSSCPSTPGVVRPFSRTSSRTGTFQDRYLPKVPLLYPLL